VRAALRPAPPPFPATISIAEAHRRASEKGFGSWPVADDDGLIGLVRLTDIATAIAEGRSDEMLGVLITDAGNDEKTSDVMVHVHPDQSLALALARMGETGHSALPVVSRENVRKIVGIITVSDILTVYGVASSPEPPAATGGFRASA
jgi:CIC family chloride channel protein